MMVQRSNFPNSDASDVRREFQKAAASALARVVTKHAGKDAGAPSSTQRYDVRACTALAPWPP